MVSCLWRIIYRFSRSRLPRATFSECPRDRASWPRRLGRQREISFRWRRRHDRSLNHIGIARQPAAGGRGPTSSCETQEGRYGEIPTPFAV